MQTNASAATAQPQGIERRAEPRFRMMIPGRFVVEDGSEHRCVTEDASITGYGIRSVKKPRVGSMIDMDLHHLGRIRAKVMRHTERGFGVLIVTTEMSKKDFAATMLFLVKAHMGEAKETRQHVRVVPARRDVILTLPDGRKLPADIANISRSGAGISTGVRPPIGSILLVGSTKARVVRQLSDGLGIEFLSELAASVDLKGSPAL